MEQREPGYYYFFSKEKGFQKLFYSLKESNIRLKIIMLKATRQPKSTKALAAPVHPVTKTKTSHIMGSLALTLVLGLQLLLGLSAFQPASARAEVTPPQIAAPAAISVDAGSGRIIYSKNMHRRVPMASTTKIMTVLTAMSIPGTSLSETYTVIKDDLVGEASIPLRLGEVISFQDLLWGTMLNSGNDGAMAIARYAGSKIPGPEAPMTKFLARMNSYAVSLGMRNSHYTNPHGLDDADHYSSAFDLAISGWYLLKNPLLSRIVATQTATVAGHPLANLNTLLKRYNGANGIKPGYTDNAGLCLVASATRDNTTVISVVLGEDAVAYNADPPLLFNYSFAQLKDPTFLQSIQQGASVATSADYIGRPDGNKLVLLNAPGDNGAINAQISTAGATPGPTVTTQADGSSASVTDPAAKKEGGFNFFTLLLVLLILLGLVYVVLRFTPLGGEKGRDMAFTLEDSAAKGLQGIRRLWGYMKPGSSDDESAMNPGGKPPKASAALNNAPDYRARLSRESTAQPANRNPQGSFDASSPGAYRPIEGYDNSGMSRGSLNSDSQGGSSSFDDMFNDAPAYNYDAESLDIKSGSGLDTGQAPQPPRPLSGRPGTDFASRVNPELAQPPGSASANQQTQPSMRPPAQTQPTRPNPSTGSYGTANTGRDKSTSDKAPIASAPGNYPAQGTTGNRIPPSYPANQPGTGSKANAGEGLSLNAHARQAIDYAYAGRIGASTEEFRRVIEQDPLFDFATIDEFEQMPVLGYKALATAYRDAGKLKFAILLLDMAVENFPNELELRNMLRHLRREAGQ